MYALLFGLDAGLICLTIVFYWLAAAGAMRLRGWADSGKLARRARAVLVCALLASVAAIGRIIVIYRLHAEFGWSFSQDKWLVHLPLLSLPLLAVIFFSIPAIARAMRGTTAGRGDAPSGDGRRNPAGELLLVIPLRAAAWTAGLSFFYVFSPPVPFTWPQLVFPLGVTALLIAYSAYHQIHRNRFGAHGQWARTLGSLSLIVVAVSIWVGYGMTTSALPDRMSMMAGAVDYGVGAGSADGHDHHHGAPGPVSVETLTGPQRQPDRTVTLTAEKQTIRFPSGGTTEAWTFNGQIPGPELRFTYGELVEVVLVNKDIEGGVTVHWHGLNVPNAEDGVAGATQNAVMPGQRHVYRFVADQTGTYWYHTHQHSAEGVKKGLFGAMIIEPAAAAGAAATGGASPDSAGHAVRDITVMTHIWDHYGVSFDPTGDRIKRWPVAAGTQVRLRLIHTDNWIQQRYSIVGAPFRVVAIDGIDLNGPTELTDTRLELTTGGRYDVIFTMPDTPVFLSIGGGKGLGMLFSADGQGDIPDVPRGELFDPAAYGEPAGLPFDLGSGFDREFVMTLDNKLGFYNGTFNQLYTINGEVFPNTPMYMVREGDLVKTTIVNRGMVDHPMHLHGHHMLVLSRNGEPVSGSPWWSDTLHLAPGDVYEIAFLADNPGIWMDHCHNLDHAAIGMTMHLMYEGVTSPFEIGHGTNNQPE